MARRLLASVMVGGVLLGASAAYAAMEVRDSTNLFEQIKQGLEQVKQTIQLTEIYKVGKDAFDVAKETMAFTKDVKDTIGPMVSLGMTASSWMRGENTSMACLIPNLGMFNINFDVTNICSGMEWAGNEFGLPMNGGELSQQRRNLLYGRYSWTSYLRKQSDGGGTNDLEIVKASPAELKELQKAAGTTGAKRKGLAHQANTDSIGLAMSVATNATSGVGEAIDSVAEMAGVVTLQERVGHTNKILARMLVQQEKTNQLLAKLLLVTAADNLKDEPILYDLPEQTWLDTGKR